MDVIEGCTSSRELRERFVAQQFVPVATEVLARAPHATGVGFAVGQYWADEAEDAVHGEYVLFTDEACAWPPAGSGGEDDGGGDWERLDALFPQEEYNFFGFLQRFPELESNGNAITAFASYCPEHCHQEMPIRESHALVYVARRAPGGGVGVEERGRMLRPEWEDRFDVGFSAEVAEAERPRGDRVGFWTRLRRLFLGV